MAHVKLWPTRGPLFVLETYELCPAAAETLKSARSKAMPMMHGLYKVTHDQDMRSCLIKSFMAARVANLSGNAVSAWECLSETEPLQMLWKFATSQLVVLSHKKHYVKLHVSFDFRRTGIV